MWWIILAIWICLGIAGEVIGCLFDEDGFNGIKNCIIIILLGLISFIIIIDEIVDND